MSEHNENYTIKSANKIGDEYNVLIEDKNANKYIGYVSKKSISVISLEEAKSDHKEIIKFLREFKETCQD